MCLKYLRANIYNNLVQYMYPDIFAIKTLGGATFYTGTILHGRTEDLSQAIDCAYIIYSPRCRLSCSMFMFNIIVGELRRK